ncbi:MAG: GTP-binding protein, partial [Paramarteilia canceri]
YQAVRAHVGREAVYFLIGNKIDLPDSDRQVTTIQGEQLAKKLGAQFFEVSVKKKVGVKDLFLNLTHTMHSIFKNELTNQGTEFMNGYGATDRTKFNVNGHNDRKVTINSPKNYNVLDSEDGSWLSCC